MAAYQSISVDLRRDGEDESDPEGPDADSRNHNRANNGNGFILPKGLRRRLLSPACLALGTVLALVALEWGRRQSSSPAPAPSSPSSFEGGDVATDLPPLPTGVNLASWFSLEDWFFVGDDGAVEVASPDDSKAASCLPPFHLDSSTGPRWNSETDLLAGLAGHYAKEIAEEGAKANSTTGGSLGGWGKAVRAIHAFRSSYYDIDDELRTMSKLGIKYVRVPVSWCWTDHDPTWLITQADNGDVNYITDDDVKEKFACEDPFYDGVYWPAIPRAYFRRFLRACARHGIGATIDLHTYPGGTSIGTFSGVWPRYSRFWTHGDVPSTDDGRRPDVGRTLLRDFIGWMESLETSDPQAFKGIRSLSPMNEPAHLAGLFDGAKPILTDRDTFLPPLPPDVASKYLSELNEGLDSQPQLNLTKVPDGNHLRVMMWLRDAIEAFRRSRLPSLGKELHVNVHESLFAPDAAPNYFAQMKVFGAWWRASTSAEERMKWAVLDMHHYHAWGGECRGSVEGPPTGSYACADDEAKAMVFKKCADWPFAFRGAMESECGKGLRLASAEFSAATHHSVRHACNDVSTLRLMLESQVNMSRLADVELFFWSYKMPYGGAFRNAWSFKHLLYLLGVLPRPDEELFHCGDHVPPPGEPKDGSI